MKRFKCSRITRALGIALVSTTLLYSTTGLKTVNAAAYMFTPNEQLCMADAYLTEPGNSLPKDKLNCTANDVEITNVDPVEDEVECTLGETFEFQANVTIKTNANERYDTTFYLPLTEFSPQVVQGNVDNCSMILPIPGHSGETADVNLDGDACGDISKALNGDEYTLYDETISMLCSDEDEDNRADFTYCAAWDNIERDNCTIYDNDGTYHVGQVPNTKSKCNCDTFNIDVFITPDAPTLTKTLIGSDTANEVQGIFKYEIEITNVSSRADIFVQSVEDIVRSSTDTSVLASFDLASSSDVTSGNLTLLATHGDHTCDTVLASLPITLTPSSPTLQCVLMMQVNDGDLPDISDEFYEDFVRATVWDKNDDIVGNDSCDPTDVPPVVVENPTCSNVETVKIKDVIPTISIDKFAISGPGYQCFGGNLDSDGKCSGTVYINEPGGDVTYKLIITNTSSVDPLTITSLTDLVTGDGTIDLLTNVTGNTCDDSLPVHLAVNGASGDSFTCQFIRDVSGDLGTTMNTATVNAIEKTGHSEGNTPTHNINASVTMIDVAPMVNLLKEVKVSGQPDTSFAATAEVDEPGGNVVYRFTITNNSPSQEDIDLLSLTDAVLDGTRVIKGLTTCAFDGTVTISYGVGNAYSCTIAASVTGDPSNNLVNTAYVTITDGESNLKSNDSIATVTFKNIPADGELTVKLSATAFITIKNTSTFEAIKLTQLKLLGSNITTANYTHFNVINGGYGGDFDNDGETYGSCDQPDTTTYVTIAANSSYRCAFTVELLTDTNAGDNVLRAAGASETIKIVVEDFDGGAVDDESVQAVVHLTPNL